MRAFFEVHLRLVITVWVILMSVLGLLYLMNYMKFDSLMSGVVSSNSMLFRLPLIPQSSALNAWGSHTTLQTISLTNLIKHVSASLM